MSIKSLFENIADAIKDKNPNVTNVTPDEMPNAIRSIPSGSSSASGVTYDNTTSGLSATNVQDAIDEVVGDVTTINSDLSEKTGFVNYSNSLVSRGDLYSGGTSHFEWTATADCFCYVLLANHGGTSMSIKIDNVTIPSVGVLRDGGNYVLAPISFYLKKGQKLDIYATQTGQAGAVNIYGLM